MNISKATKSELIAHVESFLDPEIDLNELTVKTLRFVARRHRDGDIDWLESNIGLMIVEDEPMTQLQQQAFELADFNEADIRSMSDGALIELIEIHEADEVEHRDWFTGMTAEETRQAEAAEAAAIEEQELREAEEADDKPDVADTPEYFTSADYWWIRRFTGLTPREAFIDWFVRAALPQFEDGTTVRYTDILKDWSYLSHESEDEIQLVELLEKWFNTSIKERGRKRLHNDIIKDLQFNGIQDPIVEL